MKSENNKTIRSLERKNDLKDGVFFAVMVFVPTLQFIIMYLGVNINSILLAFQEYDPISATFKYSISNVNRFITEFSTTTIFTTAIKNSLTASFFTVAVNMSLTILFALYVYHKGFANTFFKVALFIPSIISSIVMVKIYAVFCDQAIPKLIEMLFGVKIEGLLADPKTQWPTIIFFNLWQGFGPSLLVYVGGMNNISDSVSEAAHLDGANVLQETWYITLPLIYSTIVTYVVAGLVAVFMNQLSLYSFYADSADRSLYTVGYWIYRSVKTAEGNNAAYPYIAFVGVLCTVILLPVVFTVRGLMNKFGPSIE